MNAGQPALNEGTTPRRRPGPFGPASALLPVDQQVLTIPEDTPAVEALERMVDTGYSQLPVTDSAGQITGVFSWKSFGKRVSELHAARVDVAGLRVRDTDPERPRFISAETYIDTETDWSQIDYVLVGSRKGLLGVLTIADVFGRLNDFAEAFVLLFEIETEIRDLFTDVYTAEELDDLFEGLSNSGDSPEESAANRLRELIEGAEPLIAEQEAAKTIRFAVGRLQRASRQRPVTGLMDFTFAQYREVIFNRENWPRFHAVFDVPREVLNADFEEVNDLRNIVFHFRRGVTPKDTDRLRRFRDKLRYNRDLFNTRRSDASDET